MLIVFPLLSLSWVLLTVVVFLGMLILEENEHPGKALTVLIVYFILCFLLGDFTSTFLPWMSTHKWFLFIAALVYIPLGFMWGVFRFWWEESRNAAEYIEAKTKFLRKHGIHDATASTEIPDALIPSWKVVLKVDHYTQGWESVATPKHFFAENKSRIINWMVWFPLSMLAFALKDFLLQFYQILLNRTRRLFETIERQVWRETENDFVRVKEFTEKERKEKERPFKPMNPSSGVAQPKSVEEIEKQRLESIKNSF